MAPGQVQENVIRLTRRLSDDGMRHLVCVRGPSGGLSDRLEMDVGFFSLDLNDGDSAAAGLAKVIQDHRPDVVHVRQQAMWPEAVKACKRTHHHGLLLSHHDSCLEGELGWLQRWRYQRMYRTTARAGLADSPPAARHLARRLNIDSSEIPVVTSGVDARQFHPDAKTRSGDADTIHWGTVGRLDTVNNWQMVIRVMHRLHKKGIKIHLDIIGDGPSYDELQACIVEHGLEASAAMLAISTRRDWYMRQWDAFLLTTTEDALGYGALLEAMSSGLAVTVVGTSERDRPVQAEKTGLVVHRGNESQLFDAMRRISTSLELRQALGQAAREVIVDRYSDAAAAQKYAWIYEWISAHPGRGIDDFVRAYALFDRDRGPAAK